MLSRKQLPHPQSLFGLFFYFWNLSTSLFVCLQMHLHFPILNPLDLQGSSSLSSGSLASCLAEIFSIPFRTCRALCEGGLDKTRIVKFVTSCSPVINVLMELFGVFPLCRHTLQCTSCHGVEGKGNGPLASTLAVSYTHLTLPTRRTV